ncbi:LLM class flavin-dependent oxidoreductase [Streptomyces sp. NEAU-YJ-81]|uniref:LLM class flavin-dependent oxidoreductase n=1 Tax=Streptomyces sp. NEAU-YJ-81 TaxID=2820288 RepID=UPI0035B3297C
MLAKSAAGLDVLAPGRVQLGLGTGAFWDAIAAMGGPRREAKEAVAALDEAIEIIRLMWSVSHRCVSGASTTRSAECIRGRPPRRTSASRVWRGSGPTSSSPWCATMG